MLKQIFLYLMSGLYLAAGINHFVNPKPYVRIIPSWLPNPEMINYISGALEIIFAVLLIPRKTRPTASWLIIALLIAVFPANIQMSIQYYERGDPFFWFTIIRLPLQILMIWWAWQYTKQKT